MFGLVSYFILFTVYLLVVIVYSNYDRKKKKKLLIAKLYAYGFDKVLSNFIYPCLRQRKQKTKVGSTFSDLLKILFGVPRGSILDRFNL